MLKTGILLLSLIGVTKLLAYDEAKTSPFDMKIEHSVDTIHMLVRFSTALNSCGAYQFITDYENAKKITGVKQSKIISRQANTVLVDRLAEERILGFPVEMHTVEKYVEESDQKISFELIKGDPKSYKGSWNLQPDKSGTQFIYQADLQMGSWVPNWVVEHFLKNSVKSRFQEMAALANSASNEAYSVCSSLIRP